MDKLTKHDRYVHELKAQLAPFYDSLSTNVQLYGKKRRSLGEIDLIGTKGSATDIYEVKCSRRITKAKKQLYRLKKMLEIKKGNLFFYCGSSKELVMV